MLFFFHLFTGLILGAVLALLFRNRRAVIYTGIGAVLSDLLDKPLGHILLSGSINDGQIFSHTLLVVLVLFIAGLILWKTNPRRILCICLGAGVFLHQIADQMWEIPENWFWPLFGPFRDAITV